MSKALYDAVVKGREINGFIEFLGACSWPAFTKVPVLSKKKKRFIFIFYSKLLEEY